MKSAPGSAAQLPNDRAVRHVVAMLGRLQCAAERDRRPVARGVVVMIGRISGSGVDILPAIRPAVTRHLEHPRSAQVDLNDQTLGRQLRSGDDANTQIMRLFGDEMRIRPVRRLADLSDRTKAELLHRYDALAKANPKDPAVKRHIELLEQAGGKR